MTDDAELLANLKECWPHGLSVDAQDAIGQAALAVVEAVKRASGHSDWCRCLMCDASRAFFAKLRAEVGE